MGKDIKEYIGQQSRDLLKIEELEKRYTNLEKYRIASEGEIKYFKNKIQYFENKIEKKFKDTFNTISIFSFIIVLTISLLVPLLNATSPIIHLFKEQLWVGLIFTIFITSSVLIFAYCSFMKLLDKLLDFWNK